MDKAFVKGLKLIEILAASDDPRGVTSLAVELGLTKSNVHRLLTTLTSCGYVRKDENSASYELSSRIWELGILVRSKLDIIRIAEDQMARLAHATAEAVHLSVLDGLEVVYVDKVESTHPIASYTRVGGRSPAWAVATGKAMLAHMPFEQSEAMGQLKAFTTQTIAEPAQLRAELETIRAKGYALNRGEWREGVFGIAAPIWDATGSVVGAIGISGPGARFRLRQTKIWAGLVIEAADVISRRLGAREQATGRRIGAVEVGATGR